MKEEIEDFEVFLKRAQVVYKDLGPVIRVISYTNLKQIYIPSITRKLLDLESCEYVSFMQNKINGNLYMCFPSLDGGRAFKSSSGLVSIPRRMYNNIKDGIFELEQAKLINGNYWHRIKTEEEIKL